MNETIEKILVNKVSAIKSFTLQGQLLVLNKSKLVEGDVTCNKLICNNIEIKESGNNTLINNAIITKSTIKSTTIGIIDPRPGKFTKIAIEATQLNSAFTLDGDINIKKKVNPDNRFINCLENPLNIISNNLKLESYNKLDLITNIKENTNLITNVFNINTSYIKSTGYINILDTTNSTQINNGCLILNGGLGIKKDTNIGGNINILNNAIINNNIITNGTLFINNSNNIAINVNGGVNIKKNLNINDSLILYNNIHILNNNNNKNIINGSTIIKNNLNIYNNLKILKNVNINNTLDSYNINTGSLIVNGGVGIAKNVNIGGNLNIKNNSKFFGNLTIYNTTDSTNINNGSLIINGGVGITKNINIGSNAIINNSTLIKGNLNILNTEDSFNLNSGSLINYGGLVVKKNINTNGIVIIHNTNDSNSINNGSLIVNGGVAIQKNLNVGSFVNIGNNLNVENNLIVKNKSYFSDDINLNNDLYLNNIHITGKILKTTGGLTTDYDLIVAPGAFSDLIIHNSFKINNSDDSYDINSGSFINDGGMAVKKNVNIGQDLNVFGNSNFHNNVNVLKTLYAENLHVKYNITTSNGNISGNTVNVGTPEIPFDNLAGNLNITNNISITQAFSAIDQYLNKHLINVPVLTKSIEPLITSGSIELYFNLPEQIHVGFFNQKLPIINSIYIDYKLSNSNNYTTINTESNSVNKIIIHVYPYTNYINNNTYNLFNLLPETLYDFRIYAKNYNTTRPNVYIYYNNLKTIPITELSPPTNIIISNNTPTSIDINFTHSTTTILPVYQYNINYKTYDSIKYPNYINHFNNNLITSTNVLYNSNNFTTINNLYPGHTYNVNIQARNIIGNFGNISENINILTNYPIAPNFINNNNLHITNNNNYLFNISSGYLLDGNTYVKNIYNYTKLNDDFSTNILKNIRITENIATTDLNSTKLICNLNRQNTTIKTTSLNLNGFSHNNYSTTFTDKLNIKINNTKDYYNNIFNNGFYKTTDLQIVFNNCTNYLQPSQYSYKLQITQNLPFSNINYNSNILNINVDHLTNFPELINTTINTIDEINYTYISGVPTVLTGNINYDLKTKYLTNNYLRADKKHFKVYFNNSNSIITSDTIKNSNNYYNLDNTLHNDGKTILPNTQDLLFKNHTIQINSNIYTENLKLNIILYNLHGESIFTYLTKIRLDNNSNIVKNNILSIVSNYGRYVKSGIGTYPDITANDFGEIFDHNLDITNTQDLQLVNGYFCTPYNNNSFLNYSNNFNITSLNNPTYNTVLINNTYRYITFLYFILNNIETNKITIEFIDSNIDTMLGSTIQLFIKIVNTSNTEYNTAWLDANKPIDIIGLNNNTKNINGTGCLNMYSDYISTPIKKYCYLPNGTNGILYIRLGLPSNKDYLIKYIKVSRGFI